MTRHVFDFIVIGAGSAGCAVAARLADSAVNGVAVLEAGPAFSSAAATSMLTILGVVILLTPVLIRTWRDFNRKVV